MSTLLYLEVMLHCLWKTLTLKAFKEDHRIAGHKWTGCEWQYYCTCGYDPNMKWTDHDPKD